MSKRDDATAVNSSYSIFFGLSVLVLSYFLSNFGQHHLRSWVIIALNVMLIYVLWDLVRQLYSPGQAVTLYMITFWGLPILMMVMDEKYWLAQAVIWPLALIIAGILELIYETFIKAHAPKNVVKRFILVDSKIDKSLLRISDMQLSLGSFAGLLFGVFLVVSYLLLSWMLVQ